MAPNVVYINAEDPDLLTYHADLLIVPFPRKHYKVSISFNC